MDDVQARGKRFSQGVVIAHQRSYPFENAIRVGQKDKASKTAKAFPAILHSADYLKGMSGGPLLNESGQVIGINSTALNMNKSDFNYCVGIRLECAQLSLSASEILQFLRESVPGFGKSEVPRDSTSSKRKKGAGI